MLIEAARGGHSNVVNLLLRQPRFTEALRNQILASRQAAAVSNEQQRLTQGRKRSRSHPHPASGKSRKKSQKPASVSSASAMMDDATTHQHDSQILTMAAKCRLHPQHIQGHQPVQTKRESSAKVAGVLDPQAKLSGASNQQKSFAESKGAVPVLSHNHTGNDTAAQKPEGKMPAAPDTQQQQQPIQPSSASNGQHVSSEDPGKFTLNPSYNFNNQASVLAGYPLFPNLPQGSIPTVFTASPSQESSKVPSKSAVPSYLLPSIFSHNQPYSDALPEYLMSQEALQNHMIDFAKQQALVTVLEGLVLQNDTQKSDGVLLSEELQPCKEEDKGGGEGEREGNGKERKNTSTKTTDLHDPLEAKSDVDARVNASAKSLSMQQSLLGVSTALGGLHMPLLDNIGSEHLPDGSRSPGDEEYVIDKRYLEAFQSQMLANLEQAGLIPSLLSSLDGSMALNTSTTQALDSEATNTFASTQNNTASENNTQSDLPHPQTPPVPSSTASRTGFPMDTHKPHACDQLNDGHTATEVPRDSEISLHPGGEGLSASFLLNANFPVDIPPPTDLIPDHVSVM